MDYPGFIGGAYSLSVKNIDAQRCINLYVVRDEKGTGKDGSPGMLLGTPGKRLLVNFPIGTHRGIYTSSNGVMFCVVGASLYRVSATWTYTLIGALATASGSVCFADNGVQLMIVDGYAGYIYTLSSGVFAQVSDPDMPKASHVKFCDGYFVLNQVDTGRFYVTALYDGFSINSLDFATAEGSPDNILAVEVLRKQIWFFGAESTQVYYNVGDADFPFYPINGVFIEYGAAAKFSVVKVDQTLFWLGANKDGQGVVYMANGYSPVRISNTAIDYAIQSYGDISNVVAYGYQQDGATFYVLNFDNTSWAYDLATGEWHERCFLNNGNFERDRANYHCFFNNTHVVADYANGKLYALDFDYFTDDVSPIKRLRAAPHISNGLRYLYYSSFEIDMQFGVGTNTGQGSNPLLMMRQSNDGGYAWSSERLVSVGLIGQYTARAQFNRCGRGRDRIFEVSITDPVRVAFIGAKIEATEGRT